ncbi:hypothetical protein EDB86DRAFT_2831395 [Lactarius hatsudake]|nr:hypothetical protein EDB86DRAFT_2831395 [Lactarius hatsudake]
MVIAWKKNHSIGRAQQGACLVLYHGGLRFGEFLRKKIQYSMVAIRPDAQDACAGAIVGKVDDDSNLAKSCIGGNNCSKPYLHPTVILLRPFRFRCRRNNSVDFLDCKELSLALICLSHGKADARSLLFLFGARSVQSLRCTSLDDAVILGIFSLLSHRAIEALRNKGSAACIRDKADRPPEPYARAVWLSREGYAWPLATLSVIPEELVAIG